MTDLSDDADLVLGAGERNVLMYGEFSQSALPDLLRALCARGESLRWELSAQLRYTVILDRGRPVDASVVDAAGQTQTGLPVLRQLMHEAGGTFLVDRHLPLFDRRTLYLSGEKLLMELARQDDEELQAPRSADEALLADDWFASDHRTALNASAADLALPDAMQLFKVSRRAYDLILYDPLTLESPGGARVEDGQLLSAWAPGEVGVNALGWLLEPHDTLKLLTRPSALADCGTTPIGEITQLLLRQILGGQRPVLNIPDVSLMDVPPPDLGCGP